MQHKASVKSPQRATKRKARVCGREGDVAEVQIHKRACTTSGGNANGRCTTTAAVKGGSLPQCTESNASIRVEERGPGCEDRTWNTVKRVDGSGCSVTREERAEVSAAASDCPAAPPVVVKVRGACSVDDSGD